MVNHCLTFDASVTNPGSMEPLGRDLDELVANTAAYIIDADSFNKPTALQIRLSAEFGGCGLRSAADRCATAFAAAALRVAPRWNPAHLHTLTGAFQDAQKRLEDMGVHLNQRALPLTGTEATFTFPQDATTPLTKRQRTWWQCIDQGRCRQLVEHLAKQTEGEGGPHHQLHGTRRRSMAQRHNSGWCAEHAG